MSEIAKTIERIISENWEKFVWIFSGAWVQVMFMKSKGIEFSFWKGFSFLGIASFVGYWVSEIVTITGYPQFSNLLGSLSAVFSNNILNYYNQSIPSIIKALLKGKFKIEIEQSKDNNEENPQ